jgi:PadR family transcriptional regulator, regulatory protein AphA
MMARCPREVRGCVVPVGGPFPHRLHLIERQSTFRGDFYRNLIEWCEKSFTEIEQWPDTHNVGLTPRGRAQWERILAEPER